MGRIKDIDKHKRVNPHEVFKYLTEEKGLSYNKAMGMLANIKYESDFRPTITEKGVASGGIGLFQHTGPRRKQLDAFVGGDYSNWKKQIDFALSEPDTKNYLNKKFSTPEEASYYFTTKWERPKDSHEQGLKRQGWIKQYLNSRGFEHNQQIAGLEEAPQEEIIYQEENPIKINELEKDVKVEGTKRKKVQQSDPRAFLAGIEEEKQKQREQIEQIFTRDEQQKPQDFQPYHNTENRIREIAQNFNTTPLTQVQNTFQDGGNFIYNESGPRNYIPDSTDYENYEPTDEEKSWMMSKIVSEAGKGNVAARRMMDENTKDYTFKGNEWDEQMNRPAGVPAGEKGSHFSASMGDSFVPFLQEGPDGNLYYNGKANPRDKEAIHFDTEQEAEFFANYYKKANPPMMREWTKKHFDNQEEFQEGGIKTHKSKNGTITNVIENKDGSKTVQVKTKDGKYYEKVIAAPVTSINSLTGKPLVVIPKNATISNDYSNYKEEDGWKEDVAELFDPTGITSWDDVRRAYDENGLFDPKTGLEILGALPLIGKIGKSGKILAGGEKLFIDAVKYFGYNDIIGNAYKAYRNMGGKNLDNILGLTTKGLVKTFPKLDPTKWAANEGLINGLNRFTEVARGSKFLPYLTEIANTVVNYVTTPRTDDLYEQKQKGGIIVDPQGQWQYPGENTLIPEADGRITMKDVEYPVLGIDDEGNYQEMYPEEEYQFPGNNVLEIPLRGDIDSLIDPTRIEAFKKLFQ